MGKVNEQPDLVNMLKEYDRRLKALETPYSGWTNWSPVIRQNYQILTNNSPNAAYYFQFGKIVFINIDSLVVSGSNGGGPVTVTLPIPPKSNSYGSGTLQCGFDPYITYSSETITWAFYQTSVYSSSPVAYALRNDAVQTISGGTTTNPIDNFPALAYTLGSRLSITGWYTVS